VTPEVVDVVDVVEVVEVVEVEDVVEVLEPPPPPHPKISTARTAKKRMKPIDLRMVVLRIKWVEKRRFDYPEWFPHFPRELFNFHKYTTYKRPIDTNYAPSNVSHAPFTRGCLRTVDGEDIGMEFLRTSPNLPYNNLIAASAFFVYGSTFASRLAQAVAYVQVEGMGTIIGNGSIWIG
jgi:hypothetical protein